jgi:hypothetical protein
MAFCRLIMHSEMSTEVQWFEIISEIAGWISKFVPLNIVKKDAHLKHQY